LRNVNKYLSVYAFWLLEYYKSISDKSDQLILVEGISGDIEVWLFE